MPWITPVTDRAADAQYTHDDLNRVGNDLQYLADLLNGYGYAVTVNPKTDWAVGEKPETTDMTQYLADLNAIKTAFYGTTPLPESMNKLDVLAANNIEKLLVEIETYIIRMAAAFVYSGEIFSGEV